MSGLELPTTLTFQGNGGSYPPHGIITAIDNGLAVVVTTWILMCLMALGVIARFGTRHTAGDKENITICRLAVGAHPIPVHAPPHSGTCTTPSGTCTPRALYIKLYQLQILVF